MGDRDELKPSKRNSGGDNSEGNKIKVETSEVEKLLKEGKIDEALKIAGKGDIGLLNKVGIGFAEKEKFPHALNLFNRILEIDSKETIGYYNRGLVYNLQKNYQEAIADYTKAIELDPKYADAYNNRGTVYAEQKQLQKAIEDFNKTIKLDLKFPESYYNRGLVYYEQKQFQKAIADYTKAIELDPKDAETCYNRGLVYYEQKQFQKAIADYTKAIELDPKFSEAYNDRGNVYSDLKKYQKAIEDYNRAINLNLEYADAYNSLGFVYFKQQEFQKAIENFTKSIELDPKEELGYSNRGESYYEFGKEENTNKYLKKSKRDLEEAIRLNSEFGEAHNLLGIISAELGDTKEAGDCFEKAIKYEPNNPKFHRNLIKLETGSGKKTRDWWTWWFGGSIIKKLFAGGLIFISMFGICIAMFRNLICGCSIDISIVFLIICLLVLLVFPEIRSVNAGSVGLEKWSSTPQVHVSVSASELISSGSSPSGFKN